MVFTTDELFLPLLCVLSLIPQDSVSSMVLEVPVSEIFNSFDDVGRVMFSKETVERVKTRPSLFASGDAKASMFQQRYYMILQQIFRDSKFIDTARGKRGADFPTMSFMTTTEDKGVNGQSLLQIHDSEDWRFEVTPVESLPGSTGIKIVFGMLSLGENGRYTLEDLHQAVPVKVDRVMASNDFITNNTFVLAKGVMIDDIFNISELTLPPVPKRSLCEATVNLFGGPVEMTDEIVINTVGTAPEDSSIAIISGLALDNPLTFEKLNILFTGFEECDAIPNAYILVGDFTSRPFNVYVGDSVRLIQKCFDSLSQLLARHPRTIECSQIILVPGPGDPGSGLLPQPSLSDSMVRGISSRFPNVVLATNPCRLRFYEKQILIFAGRNLKRLRKSRIVNGHDEENSGDDQGRLLMRYLLSQMHLAPGPVSHTAVSWEHDGGLRLYPPPHSIFVIDPEMKPFSEDVHGETMFVSMPAFATSENVSGEFHLYSPSTNESTPSSV